MTWLSDDERGFVEEEPPLDLRFLHILTPLERYADYVLVITTLVCVIGIALGYGR